jgi:hypothetical protein
MITSDKHKANLPERVLGLLGGLPCDLTGGGADAGRGSRIENYPQVLQFINSLTIKKSAHVLGGSNDGIKENKTTYTIVSSSQSPKNRNSYKHGRSPGLCFNLL